MIFWGFLASVVCTPNAPARPAVVIVSPNAETLFAQNELVSLEIMSVSPSGIKEVTIYIDGRLLERRINNTRQSSFIVQQAWKPETAGTHLLEIEARDFEGNTSPPLKRLFDIQPVSASTAVAATTPLPVVISTPPSNFQSSGRLIYDFTAQAEKAVWYNSHNFPINWNGLADNPQGMARLAENIILEDGLSYPQALEIHPEWLSGGQIIGRYQLDFQPEAGDRFVTQIGFVKNAGASDGVTFKLCFVTFLEETCLAEIYKPYSQQLMPVKVDLSPLNDYNAGWFELQLNAGQTSNQDWAVWLNPRIER